MKAFKSVTSKKQRITNLTLDWRSRLANECPEQTYATRESIVNWLLGSDRTRFEQLQSAELVIAQQAMEYRYRILRDRYLRVGAQKAYCNLMTRLSSLVLLGNKIPNSVSPSRDRYSTVVEMLQLVIQELLQSDRYIHSTMVWISECTTDKGLKNILLFASLEDYCLRPVSYQPLIVYRCINYLRHSERGGLTQVSNSDTIKVVSEDILIGNSKNPISLLDVTAIAENENE